MNITEFAKAVGLAQSTVSAAIAGKGRVSAATRAMVRQKMLELDYTPNLNGRRLACGRSNLIAFCHVDYEPLGDLHSVELARAMIQPLSDYGYDLFHILARARNEIETYSMLRQRLKSSAVDGIVLLGGERLPCELLESLTCDGYPCVVVGNRPVQGVPLVGSVVADLRPGLRSTARMLVKYGHREIAFVDNDLQDNFGEILAEELAELAAPLSEKNRVVAKRSLGDGGIALSLLMAQAHPPTAVVARTDTLAISIIRKAREIGLHVPEDISVLGCDDLAILPLIEPGLTTIGVSDEGLANATTEMMMQLLHDPKSLRSPQEIPTTLIERKTVGPVSSAKQ